MEKITPVKEVLIGNFIYKDNTQERTAIEDEWELCGEYPNNCYVGTETGAKVKVEGSEFLKSIVTCFLLFVSCWGFSQELTMISDYCIAENGNKVIHIDQSTRVVSVTPDRVCIVKGQDYMCDTIFKSSQITKDSLSVITLHSISAKYDYSIKNGIVEIFSVTLNNGTEVNYHRIGYGFN